MYRHTCTINDNVHTYFCTECAVTIALLNAWYFLLILLIKWKVFKQLFLCRQSPLCTNTYKWGQPEVKNALLSVRSHTLLHKRDPQCRDSCL